MLQAIREMIHLVSPTKAPTSPDSFLIQRMIDAENQICVGVATPGGYEGIRIGDSNIIHRITETDCSMPDKIRYTGIGIEMEFYSCSKSVTGICYNLWMPDDLMYFNDVRVPYKTIALRHDSANLDRIELLGFSDDCRRRIFNIEQYLRMESSDAAVRGLRAQYAHVYEECKQPAFK
jgi:hypothetical protein